MNPADTRHALSVEQSIEELQAKIREYNQELSDVCLSQTPVSSLQIG